MLKFIIGALLVLWLLGFIFKIAGGIIHILLVIAAVLLIINLVKGRRTS
ncbi:lmo0937 family membrane protein [Bacillus infantis]